MTFFQKLLAIFSFALLALPGGGASAEDASLVEQIRLTPLSPLASDVWDAEAQSSTLLKPNDISVSAAGEIWIAAENGLVRQRGVAWEKQNLKARLSEFFFDEETRAQAPDVFAPIALPIKKVTVSPDGEPWFIDGNDALFRYIKSDDSWLKVTTDIADAGAGKSSIWVIPTKDSTLVKRNNGQTVIVSGKGNGINRVYQWRTAFGNPVSIDVDDQDVPYIVTDTGKVVKYAFGNWQEVSVSCSVESDDDCDTTRVFRDVAAGPNGVWFTGTGDKTGDFTSHYSGGKFSGANLFARLAPGTQAVGTDAFGGLYAIDNKGRVVSGELFFDYRKSQSDAGFLVLAEAVNFPVLSKFIDLGNQTTPLSSAVPNMADDGFDFTSALDPVNGAMTVSFYAYAPEGGTAAGEQCLLSYGSVVREYWSVCLDAQQQNLVIKVGSESDTVPVQRIGSKAFIPGQGTRDASALASLFVLEASYGFIKVTQQSLQETIDETGKKDTKYRTTELGEIVLFEDPGISSLGASLHLGSRQNGADKFTGHMGTVRIWNEEVPADKLAINPSKAIPASAITPGRQHLVFEAVLNPERGIQPQTDLKFEAPFDLSGNWYPAGKGSYDVLSLEEGRAGSPFGLGIDPVEVVNISYLPLEFDYTAQRLQMHREGAGGFVSTSFELSKEGIYKGWQDPLTKNIVGDKPIEVKPLDDNAILVNNPNSGKQYTLKRIPEAVQLDKPGTDQETFESSFVGYDITAMSPDPQTTKRKNRIFNFDDASKAEDKLPEGLIYLGIDMGKAKVETKILETTRALQDDLRLGVGVSVEVPESASFTNDNKFQRTIENMAREKSLVSAGDLWWAAFAVVLDRGRTSLDAQFVKDVNRAADDLKDPGSGISLRALIDTYGTHYTNHVLYGARGRFHKAINDTELQRAAEQQWDSEVEAGGRFKAVEVKVKGSFGLGKKTDFARSVSNENAVINTQGGTLAPTVDEMVIGEELERVRQFSLDLRLLSELLSPLYFDDPYIYNNLRRELSLEIGRYVMEKSDIDGLSNESLTPEVYVINVEKLLPSSLGDGKLSGEVVLYQRKPGQQNETRTVLWSAEANDQLQAIESIEQGVPVSTRKAISILPVNGDRGSVRIEANLKSEGTNQILSKTSVNVPLLDIYSNKLVSIGEDCACVTACPDGYEDEDGRCLKTCPAEFDERNSTCYGTQSMKAFLYEDDCKSANPSRGCEKRGAFLYFPKCPKKYTKGLGWTCIPQCRAFGLENYDIIFDRVTCSRPESDRDVSRASPNNACAPGTVPGNDCGRVEIPFTVRRMPLNLEE